MRLRGRGLRLTAVLALTVLALTGFSRGHGHGRHGSGGGGCSSSSQDHDSTSSSSGGLTGSGGGSTYDPDDSYGGTDDDSYGDTDDSSGSSTGGYRSPRTHRPTSTATGSGRARTVEDGTVELLSCATATTPYATVEVTNPNKREVRYTAVVHFLDGSGAELRVGRAEVDVPARGTAKTRVQIGAAGVGTGHCKAEPTAERAD
ncbi:hypothetical protein [Streptomyces sp. NPDC059597]|uniref:hypothetical protein n=1 Tax=Streptomyces sp. NPDC059597 TaxID=3346879 RepID=UPI0036A1D3E2